MNADNMFGMIIVGFILMAIAFNAIRDSLAAIHDSIHTLYRILWVIILPIRLIIFAPIIFLWNRYVLKEKPKNTYWRGADATPSHGAALGELPPWVSRH